MYLHFREGTEVPSTAKKCIARNDSRVDFKLHRLDELSMLLCCREKKYLKYLCRA
jgi:hypothetical protein